MSISPTIPPAEPGDPGVPRKSRLMLGQIVYLLFCFEVGSVLLMLPWTLLWDNNYFFSLQPQYSEIWLSNHLRGAVSGIGLVNLFMGTMELTLMIVRRAL